MSTMYPAQVGIYYRESHRGCSSNPNSYTLKPNRPQQDRRPAAFFNAQQYTSVTFGSLCFQTREEKHGTLFKILLQLIIFFNLGV